MKMKRSDLLFYFSNPVGAGGGGEKDGRKIKNGSTIYSTCFWQLLILTSTEEMIYSKTYMPPSENFTSLLLDCKSRRV